MDRDKGFVASELLDFTFFMYGNRGDTDDAIVREQSFDLARCRERRCTVEYDPLSDIAGFEGMQERTEEFLAESRTGKPVIGR